MKRTALAIAAPVVVFLLLYVLVVRPQRSAAEAAERRARVPTRDVVLAILGDAGVRGLTAIAGPTARAADKTVPLHVTFNAPVEDVRRVLRDLDVLPTLRIDSVELAFQNGSRSVRAQLKLVDRM